MSCYFDIVMSEEIFELASGDGRTFSITVTNRTDHPCRIGVKFTCDNDDFDTAYIVPERENNVPVEKDATESLQFVFNFPATVGAGTYSVVPTVYDVDSPDEIYTAGNILTVSVVVPQASVEPVRRSEWIIALVTVAIIFCVIAGVGIALLRPIQEQLRYRSLLALFDPKTTTMSPSASMDFWKSDKDFQKFLQRVYMNGKPSAVTLMWALKRYVGAIEKDQLFLAFGGLTDTKSGRSKNPAFKLDAIESAYSIVFKNEGSLDIADGCHFSFAGRNDIDNGAEEKPDGISSMVANDTSFCLVDLKCDRSISLIELYDYHKNESRLGLGRFRLSILDKDKNAVWEFRPRKEYRSDFAVSVPQVVGRYIKYQVEGSDYLSISRVRAYETNFVLDSNRTLSFRNLTDGDPSSFFSLVEGLPVTLELDDEIEVDRIEIVLSSAGTEVDSIDETLAYIQMVSSLSYSDAIDELRKKRIVLTAPSSVPKAEPLKKSMRSAIPVESSVAVSSPSAAVAQKLTVSGGGFSKEISSGLNQTFTVDCPLVPMKNITLSIEGVSLPIAEVRVFGIRNSTKRYIGLRYIGAWLSSASSADPDVTPGTVVGPSTYSATMEASQEVAQEIKVGQSLSSYFSTPVTLERILFAYKSHAGMRVAIALYNLKGEELKKPPEFDLSSGSIVDYSVETKEPVSHVKISAVSADEAQSLSLRNLKFYWAGNSPKLPDFAKYSYPRANAGKLTVTLDAATKIKRIRLVNPTGTVGENSGVPIASLRVSFFNATNGEILANQALNVGGSYGMIEPGLSVPCKTFTLSSVDPAQNTVGSIRVQNILIEGEN